jgi:hypothetical protein
MHGKEIKDGYKASREKNKRMCQNYVFLKRGDIILPLQLKIDCSSQDFSLEREFKYYTLKMLSNNL